MENKKKITTISVSPETKEKANKIVNADEKYSNFSHLIELLVAAEFKKMKL